MKTLTVFTPTYNRAYCLGQCYDSLVRQVNQDFVWLIIDDGSSDNTKELVETWIKEGKISIKYHFQENQGMHGGHNSAYSLIETELNVCIDSDDFMPDNAVDEIMKFWSRVEKDSKIAGIIGLDSYKNGTVIGQKIPEHITKTTVEDLYYRYNVSGDKKIVYRTEVVQKYPPYPLFKKERFVPLGVLYLLIDKNYELLCLNEVLCVVEYMEDGSSRNIVKQYYRHPKGFQYARMINMRHSKYIKVRFKNAVHFVSHSLQLLDFKMFNKTPRFFLTIFAFPIGVLLYGYVRYINTFKK
ncbi:glycosyltransferase involved in cell wall biosynthesis [Aquimarina sp. MAR_2010_214]|uniref:glycosyltransferase family 2 protein n=1 Tax=Aquimarina sp. MAR_2010_214 TaxID=1250026 RepID=UPI000C70A40D|nr:glycosyltransferase family A protein [Aquimarina sp. MAR_2010_214]PKV50983.1 glycosyltransferase involved in cell wall biosynthesis [Aquimarina sp. MAR_2010_214]